MSFLSLLLTSAFHWNLFLLFFSHKVMSNSLWLYRLQHSKLPCPSLPPRVFSNSCPLSQWYHPTISSSVVPFSSCPQSFPESGSFPMSWPFTSGGQSWSFSFSVSPSNEYSGLILFRIDWFDLLAIQGTLKSVFQYHSLKASILQHSAFFMVQLSHPYMATGKTIALTGHPSWLSGKEPACQCKRHRFDPWVSEFPWRRKWQPTPVFFPGKSHRRGRSLVGYSPWGCKRVRLNLATQQW